MATRSLCVLLTFLISASQTFAATLPPIDPNFKLPPFVITADDVNYAVLDEGYPFQWCPIRQPPGGVFLKYVPATQPCMDAMTETSLVYMILLSRLLRYIPGGDKKADFCLSDSQGASAITALLNPVYEGNFGEYRGTWQEDWSGKDYSKPHYCQKKARSFLLYNPTAAAAAPEAALLMPWLNLKVVNNKVVESPLVVSFPEEKIDKRYKELGTINYDQIQPPLTEPQKLLLHETHRLHGEGSDAKCGGPAPSGSASLAHQAFQASARNETEHHFFVLKRFAISGFASADPRWLQTDSCTLAKLEHHDHTRWTKAVEKGSWADARRAENDHKVDHLCLYLRNDALKIRRTDCGETNTNKCPIETCASMVARAAEILK